MGHSLVMGQSHKKDQSIFYVLAGLFILLFLLMQTAPLLYSATGDSARSLTSVLYSNSMRGSSKYLQYMGWYGTVTSMVISLVCVIGLGQIILLFICTLVYYGATNYWDNVDALKQSNAGGGGMGMGGGNQGGGMLGGITNSVGIDTIVDAFNKNMPNIKRYSDCSADSHANINVSEYSTGLEYVIQKGPSLFFAVLLLNMGWRGTLQLMTGKFVDAATVAFEALPYDRVIEWAEYKAAQETGYSFTLGIGGTPEGKVKERLARQVFAATQAVVRATDKTKIAELGANAEKATVAIEEHFVMPGFLAGQVEGTPGEQASEEVKGLVWESVKFEVRTTTTKIPADVNQGVYIKMSELLERQETTKIEQEEYDKYYVVIAMKYDKDPDQGVFTPNYYPKKDEQKDGTSVHSVSPGN